MNRTLKTTVTALALAGGGVIGLGSMAAASYGDEPPTVDETDVTGDETTVDETTADESTDVEATESDDVTPDALQAATDDAETESDADGEREGGCRGGLRNSDAIAGALGLTVDELQAERDAGSSLADIAAAQGVDVDTVVDAIVDGIEEHLAEEVAEGDLTQEEADERLATAEERAAEKVDAAPGEGGPQGLRGNGRRGPAPAPADADA